MVKVRPNAAARADNGISISAGRNEFISFQVVLQGDTTGVKAVTAALPGLSGPQAAVITGEDVSVYREALINVATASFAGGATGSWPDGLVPDVDEIVHEKRNAFPFDVPAKEARAIWVDVHVPQGAPAGTYAGQVQVSGAGFSGSVPVSLTVVDAELPSTPTLSSAFKITLANICSAHTGDSSCGGVQATEETLLARYQKMAMEHRMTLADAFLAPPHGDFSHFDAVYGQTLNGVTEGRLQGAQATSFQYEGTKDVAHYQAFAQHMKANGWFDRAFDYSGDEPPYGTTFAAIATRAAMVKQADPDFATLVTTTAQQASANNLAGLITTMVPVVNYLDGAKNPYLGDQRPAYDGWLKANGKNRVWTYQSCMSQGCAYGTTAPENSSSSGWPSYMIDASASRNRALEWVSFIERVTGELYYDTALSLVSAWSNQYMFNGNGDGNLFYPGKPSVIGGKTDIPVASIRMKLVRLGVQDFEWLAMVSQAGDAAFAQSVAKALIPNAWQVPDDGAAFERARLQLMQRYLQLTHKDVPSGINASSGGDPVSGGAGTAGVSLAGVTGCSAGGFGDLSLVGLVVVGLMGFGRRSRVLASRGSR